MFTQSRFRATLVVSAFVASLVFALAVPRLARAEHCWLYVDGVDPVSKQVSFPGFEFTKAPFQCVQQGNFSAPCSWSPGQACTDGGTCCTSVPDPAVKESILSMHSRWHTCFGNVGGATPFAGRSARWLAFHRQFEFDFDLMREALLGCGPGRCVGGICSNDAGLACSTDDQCSAHDGCFIEALDWHTNMVFPYGHFGAGYNTMNPPIVHPVGCGTGPNRPDGVVCSSCRPLPGCLYNQGSGPLNGEPPTASTAASCVGFQGSTLDQLPSLEVVAKILDASHHGNFHGEVGNPFQESCTTDAQCATLAGPPCNAATGQFCPTCQGNLCVYNTDVLNPRCSPRDPMFWRLHKRLDDTVRAWQEKRPFDLSVVVDRSGSMAQTDSSGGTKIAVAAEALRMLADLLPNSSSSRIGVVSYGSDASENLPLTPAATVNAPIQGVATTLAASVGGCTAMGKGLERAVGQLCDGTVPGSAPAKASCHPNHNQTLAAGENERKGVLLLTDGLENVAPCLRSTGSAASPVCGGTCGGEQFNFDVLGPNTQLCAIGFGQGGSLNGNLLTLLAERQGGIYMQSPAKGPNDNDNNGTGRFVDLKDFFVKCFGQLSDEFVGIDPKGTLAPDQFATEPVPYSTCDDERLTFVAGWNEPAAAGELRLMVNSPSGALVRPGNPSIESSAQDKWGFIRAPLPLDGEQGGTWRAQLIRPHNSYVNGFTTDSLPPAVSVPLVRSEIQRLCPQGCANVLYFEDGRRGGRSSYEDALAAEVATGLLGAVTRATSPADLNARMSPDSVWNLVVYAHQLTEGPEPYDLTLLGRLCGGFQPAIVTETRGLDGLDSTPAPGDPNFIPFFINSCAGGEPTGDLDFTQLTGDGRLLAGTHAVANNGYSHFSYGHTPATVGGGTQAVASTAFENTVGAISATTLLQCENESCSAPPSQNWFVDILVRGRSQLDDGPTRYTYRTGESGLMASARVLPANIPLGGYDQSEVTVEIERPTVGVGQTLLNLGQQPSGATNSADGPDGRSAALATATPIPTVKQTLTLNDEGLGEDLLARNGQWTAHIPDSDTPGQCLVDGMYRMHFKANFTKNGCTTRRELVRSTFVDVGVDSRVSNLTVTPTQDGMRVGICPQDRCGNRAGWGRQITCGPSPGCSCAGSDVVDMGNGCYTITVHATADAASCAIEGTGKPVPVKVPVKANAGADQMLECAGGGATALLEGRGSRDPSGARLTFLWSAPGITFSNSGSATPTARFPVGTTTVTLRVTSANGTNSDTMQVTVLDTTAPVLTVPPDVTISTCQPAPNIGTATAVDGCGGAVTLTNNKPVRFPFGTTVVTYFAVDSFGNATTKSQRVSVVLGDDAACCPAGTRIIRGTSNNDTLTGTSGADCMMGLGGQDTIVGNGGNDFISGGEGNDVIDGGSGNDQLSGGGGQDHLVGGTGVDFLDGGGGDDICRGGDNDDTINGGPGQDQLFGENGNDQLFGDDGDDRLEGGAGNDLLDGGGLHDVCIGGAGTDTLLLCEVAQQ